MFERAKQVVEEVAKQTDSIILMHSLSGKDSISLLDVCYPYFKRIVCVYMYTIPNLEHIRPYYIYAKKKYKGVEFLQVPSFGYYSYVKSGYLGMEQNEKQRQWTLADIIDKVREKVGIEWCALGFKQTDSLNRRLMLQGYKDGMEAISWKSKKFYPFSTYSNKDVLGYIAERHLKQPENYGTSNQSSGAVIASALYLNYLREHYPNDLQTIYNKFPAAQLILQKYDAERNGNNKEVAD